MAWTNLNYEEELVGIFNNLNVNPIAIISQSQKGNFFYAFFISIKACGAKYNQLV